MQEIDETIMNSYNADIEPDSDKWLSLDEASRIELVVYYVANNEKDIKDESIQIHSTIHMVVENQLAENIKLTTETYNRLLRQSLTRHEAIHAIGAVIAEDLFDILNNNKLPNSIAYKNRLRKLTAKRWNKGQY